MKETDKHVLSSAGVDSQRGKLLIMMSLVQVRLGEPKKNPPSFERRRIFVCIIH